MGELQNPRLTTFMFTPFFLIEQALRVYDFPLATRLEGLPLV
jgi:hypothetical protein